MTVVTDTSVILNLCVVGQESLLCRLFDEILAPDAVVAEFTRLTRSDARFAGLVFPAFIERAAPSRILPELLVMRRLQTGEIAALSLAVERRAGAVLMDEIAGRKVARALGLKVVGLLGILQEAKERSLVSALLPIIDRLEADAGFWIGSSLRDSILKDAGELS